MLKKKKRLTTKEFEIVYAEGKKSHSPFFMCVIQKSKGVKKMIDSFYHQSDGQYIIPIKGLNSLDVSYYLNHSKDPNLIHYQDHNCGMFSFKSLKEIKKGDNREKDY